MDKIVSTARLKTDPMCRSIIDHLTAKTDTLELHDAILYYDFPLFRDYEEALLQPSLLLLDKRKGVVTIKVADTNFEVTREDEELGEFHSLMFAKLLSSKRLRKTRNSLRFDIVSVLYLPPGTPTAEERENVQVSSLEGLERVLNDLPSFDLSDEEFQEVRSIVEGVKALTRARPREISAEAPKPKANILRKLEDEIANFDAHQRRAALTVASGPQRIRGLAGSGKTIVLAWKAAHLHLTHPEKKILITFYTRSLYDTIRRQITRFYRHFRDSDPNWENLHVLHAWGGKRVPGVYYNACIEHEIAPKTFNDAPKRVNPFGYVCEDLLKRVEVRQKYHFVLADEAQDFPESCFRLLFQLTVGDRDEKTIIWAYDELQSIFEPRMRSPKELFGIDKDGQPRIDLERSARLLGLGDYVSNDLVLYKCYRNPLDVLVCSHALGLGVYGPQIVQMLQNRHHWEDVGYVVESGNFTERNLTTIRRPEEHSPLAILKHESRAEIVKHFGAASFSAELDWIEQEIANLLEGGLNHEDILVICLDDRNAKTYFESLSQRLAKRDIASHDVQADLFSSSRFVLEGRVTLSTVHRAKGNEAAAVFAAGIDAIAADRGSRRARNKLFTAFTRTKGWLRVSGVGPQADLLLSELAEALGKSPRLVFPWPNLANVETLQRDLSRREEEKKAAREGFLRKMADLGYSEEDALAEIMIPEKSE